MKTQKKVLNTVSLNVVDAQAGTKFDEYFIICEDPNGQIGKNVPKAKGRINNTVRVIIRGDQFARVAEQRGLGTTPTDLNLLLQYVKLEGTQVIVDIEEHIHGAELVDDKGNTVFDNAGQPVVFKGNGDTKIGDRYMQLNSPQIVLGAEAESKILARVERIADALAIERAKNPEVVAKPRRVRLTDGLLNAIPTAPAKAEEPIPFRARKQNESKEDYELAKSAHDQAEMDRIANSVVGG